MFSTAAEPEAVATTTELAKGYMARGERVVNLLDQAVGNTGWPLLILAGIGAWRVWRRGTRDRLTSALLAWAIVWVVFSASTVFSKVDQEYVRYAAEFLGRINLATMPLLAILAGYGAAAGWETATPLSARRPLQLSAIALIGAAAVLAAQEWLAWFDR